MITDNSDGFLNNQGFKKEFLSFQCWFFGNELQLWFGNGVWKKCKFEILVSLVSKEIERSSSVRSEDRAFDTVRFGHEVRDFRLEAVRHWDERIRTLLFPDLHNFIIVLRKRGAGSRLWEISVLDFGFKIEVSKPGL